jgi:sterol desaturase/sphingolipid hydroxylase (fatty acid hydroxylase superfamily)
VSRFSLTAIVSANVASWRNGGTALSTNWHPLAIAALILIVIDFCTYWVHRIHHETPILWPFHSLHHSAEVLTPITVFRKHPIYDLFSDVARGILLGGVLGLILGLFVGSVSAMAVFNVNIFYFLFNVLGSNFRHSHIWFSYGRRLEHILISPAQHQIHHSLDVAHHNKNYGEVLAIWDWMFGTLYVPQREEVLSFGLADEHGRRLEQPHPSLWRSLWVPVRDAWRAARRHSVNARAKE